MREILPLVPYSVFQSMFLPYLPFVMLFSWFCDPGESCPARDGGGRCDSAMQNEDDFLQLHS